MKINRDHGSTFIRAGQDRELDITYSVKEEFGTGHSLVTQKMNASKMVNNINEIQSRDASVISDHEHAQTGERCRRLRGITTWYVRERKTRR